MNYPEQLPEDPAAGVRRIPVSVWIVLVLVYLALLQGIGKLLTRDVTTTFASPTSIDELWRSITVGVGVSLVFVLLIVAVLRWWRPVYVDHKPVQSWLVALPLIMIVTILLTTDYGGLADRGLGFTLLLLLSTQFVGWAEETMFRGIGLTTFRINGFSEGKVALWTTVIFGLAHATNLISEGPKAFVQVMVAALSGYFFYLVRRRTSGLFAPAILHGLWDFSLISGSVVPGETYPTAILPVLALIVMAVLVVIRRHRIEPTAAPAR